MAAAASTHDGSDGDAGDAGGSVLGDLFTPHPTHAHVAVAGRAAAGHVPLLVRVLAGNPLTGAAVFACLNTADARHARLLHPAVAGVVAGVPWCDVDIPVVDAVRWRAGLPGAVGARLDRRALEWKLTRLSRAPVCAALGGITHLDLRGCVSVTDEVLLRLPTSLRVLNVRECSSLTPNASFAHLMALTTLDCGATRVVNERTDGLPLSLQGLDIGGAHGLARSLSLMTHLRQLRVLRANQSRLGDDTLASLPSSLEELHTVSCGLTPPASFAYLAALRVLVVTYSAIGDDSLATMPPCLVNLNVRKCWFLTRTAVLPHLPALRLLDASGTAIGDALVASLPTTLVELRLVGCDNVTASARLDHLRVLRLLDVSGSAIGDALVASLPASLIELRLAGCVNVTAGARLDHLNALRVLHCIGTTMAPAALAACRARGCVVPAARLLHGHRHWVSYLAQLANGRLASGSESSEVGLWDMAVGGTAAVVIRAGYGVRALTALPGGRRFAIGTATGKWEGAGCVEVWEVDRVPSVRRACVDCRSGVLSLAVLADGRLAAGCSDGTVRIVDVHADSLVTTLSGHTGGVTALAVLPDGALASGSHDNAVRVWDLGALACVATLAGSVHTVRSLVVLRDGWLVSRDYNWDVSAGDDAVRLWDVRARTCVGVLGDARAPRWVAALAALPDGRLASVSRDDTIQVWDTRPVATTSADRAAGAVPVEVVGELGGWVGALLPLPNGRLACCGDGTLYLLDLPPPAAYEYR